MTQKNWKKLEVMYQNESISVFLDIAKFSGIWWKNADLSGTRWDCHVIQIIFGSSLGWSLFGSSFGWFKINSGNV